MTPTPAPAGIVLRDQDIPGPRPDWAHVTLTEDLEAARHLAARLWDELHHAEQRITELEEATTR